MKSSQTNTFTGGMQKDLHPMITPPNVLTDALNATIVTMNGNENVLQNDMGNARIESAYLPSGYVPIGMKEHGGIVYIAAYNPITKKGQVGSFPSPERNIDKQEVANTQINLMEIFKQKDQDTFELNTFSKKFPLFKDNLILYPGDKFSLYANLDNIKPYLTNYDTWNHLDANTEELLNKKNLISLDVVVSDSNNNLRVITGTLKRFNSNNEVITFNSEASSLEKLNTGYFIQNINNINYNEVNTERNKQPVNTFNSRVAGNCYLLETINTINSIDVSVEGYKNNSKEEQLITNFTFNKDDYAVLIFNITYKYNCPEDYIKGCKIDFGKLGTFWANSQAKKHDSYINGEYQFTEQYELHLTNSELEKYLDKDITYTITPYMTFSALSGEAITSKINFSKLNSGEVNLSTWRYLVYKDKTQLVYGLEAYPYQNQTITGVQLIFYDLLNIQNPNGLTLDTKYYNHTINIEKKKNYSGVFSEVINLPYNTIYACQINYYLSGINTPKSLGQKYLINTSLHNEHFYDTNDFSSLLEDSIRVNISGIIEPIKEVVEPQVYSQKLPNITLNSASNTIVTCKQLTDQHFQYLINYTPSIVNEDEYPFELNLDSISLDNITVNTETTSTNKETKEVTAEIKVNPIENNNKSKRLLINSHYESSISGKYESSRIDISNIFKPLEVNDLFNFNNDSTYWLTMYNYVEGHKSAVSKPKATMTGKICLTTCNSDTLSDETKAYVDAYAWEVDEKHGGDHYRSFSGSDFYIRENIENYAQNNLGSPNVLLFSGALTNNNVNRMSYSSSICLESNKTGDWNERYMQYEYLWWKGTDDHYYLLRNFILGPIGNSTFKKDKIMFKQTLSDLFSNVYINTTETTSKELFVLSFSDNNYERTFNANIKVIVKGQLQKSNSTIFKKNNKDIDSYFTDIKNSFNKLNPIKFTADLDEDFSSDFEITTQIKGVEDIYSKIQTIKNTNTLSNVSIINDNIISVDKDGNTLLPNNLYTVKDNQLVLNKDLSSTFVVQNNQVRVKPQLVSQQKEKYTMYDNTTKGYDSSCEVDFVTVPSFEIKNLKMSGLPSNFKQDKLTV